MTDLIAELAAFAEAVERTAFQMPAPNPWTPVFVGMAQQAAIVIRANASEVEATARDAERYRWLRQNADEIGWYGADSHYAFPGIRYADESHRPELDAAIDAAMRSAQEDGNDHA